MPVILQSGEVLEFSHKVSTRFGNGTLHVTSRALIIEIKKRGIVFHRWHSQMAGIEARGVRTIRVRWPEGSQMFDFEFKAWGHKEAVRRIRKRHDYANNFSAEGASRVIFDEGQRAEIRRDRAKWALGQLKDAEKRLQKWEKQKKKGRMVGADPELARDMESWRWMGIQSRMAAVNRSMRVPEHVPDHLVWHDAWLDGDYFYTYNQGWSDPNARHTRIGGGKIDEKTGAYRIPAKYVRYFHGVPYARGNAFADPDRYKVGWFIPIMTEDMLDTDMIVMHYRPRHRCENRIIICEPGHPAILGHFNDLGYSKDPNVKIRIHTSTVRWLARHGRFPAEGLRMLGIPDDWDEKAVHARAAKLEY